MKDPSGGLERADILARLSRLGIDADDSDGSLAKAVASFQTIRGIPETGVCDRLTWRSLVEAGFSIGDRVLYLKRPYFRGDDVAWLQERLGNLGFDPGRVDGIFGERTLRALKDFQSNVALPVDGICGGSTIEELKRVFGRSREHVHGVMEREHMRSISKTLSESSIAVFGSIELDPLVDLLAQRLRYRGARAISLSGMDQSRLASLANSGEVDLVTYLDFAMSGIQVSYYSGFSYTSPAGRRLADAVIEGFERLELPLIVTQRGMTLPILRETRMASVVIALDHPGAWQRYGSTIVGSLVESIEGFMREPL